MPSFWIFRGNERSHYDDSFFYYIGCTTPECRIKPRIDGVPMRCKSKENKEIIKKKIEIAAERWNYGNPLKRIRKLNIINEDVDFESIE